MAATTVQRLVLELQAKGVNATAAELEHLSRAFLNVEQSTTRSANKLESMTRAYDEISKATARRDNYQKYLNAQTEKGIALEEKHIRTLKNLEEAVVRAQSKAGQNDNTNSTGLNKLQKLTLQQTIGDVISSLSTGQSIQTILLQQGEQFLQPFGTGLDGIRNAATKLGPALLRFVLNPVTLVAGALGTATYAIVKFQNEQDALERSLNGVGRAAGVTADGLRKIALEAAKAGNMTPGQGIDAAASLAGTGKIGGDLIQKLVPVTKQFGRAFGLDEKTALEELGKAFADPAKGAEMLNDRFGDLSISTRRTIDDLAAQGKTIDAQNMLFASLSKSVANTTDTTWVLVDAFEKLKSGFMSPIQTIGAYFNNISSSGGEATQRLGDQRKAIEETASSLVKTGRISEDLAQRLAAVAQPFGKAFGIDEKAALDELGKAFINPSDGAKNLNERFGELNNSTLQNIDNLVAHGKTIDAQNILLASLNKSIQTTTVNTWSLTSAFDKLKSGALAPIQAISQYFTGAASNSQDAAQKAIAQRKALDDAAIKAANDLAATARPVVERELPLLITRQTLQNNVELLRGLQDNDRAMKALGLSTSDVSRALDQYSNRLATLTDEATQTRQETEARTKAALEQNVVTRAGIEAAQEYQQILAKTGDAQLAAARADAIRADSMASVSVAMRDFNKEAANQLELAGKSPFQQQIIRLDQEAKALQDQYGSVPASMDAKYIAADRQYKTDKITNPIADAEARMRVLETQNNTLGMSTQDAAKEIAAQEKRNELLKDQIEMTPTIIGYIDQYAEAQGRLAAATEAATRKQQQFAQDLDLVRSSAVDVGTSLADAFRKGENAGQAMLKLLDRLVSKLTEMMMTRGIEALLGGSGTSNTGILGSMFSNGAKSGGASSMLSSLGKMFSFANGGVMTSGGEMPLRRYAGGGVATKPQMALFGEGARNEAYVPLPDGRRIPVSMQGGAKSPPKITINNYTGANVEARQMSDGEIMVTVQNMIAAGLKRVPGIMADAQKRSL